MQVIDQQKYDDWKAKNADDPYGADIFRYAEAWAGLLEERMTSGASIEELAEQTSAEADTGITGFMYGMAVSVLAQCWIHGEALRRWHNLKTQLGAEGETANANGTVLNPALLSFS
jgi:hypothetical protein